ncbi:hypothetical protein [Acidithiobacillus sp. AMEEHan]|uniref:hypothetical protein n=1 Tax=Acidithiobacillus sp. AMEEHan TaxID=2994951 RepID=UPI0027E54B31|nr:hypothetical protein [Acidithiobacillus sp. AMEEHan]
MSIEGDELLQKALASKEENYLDAAYAVLGGDNKNDQVAQLAGFFFDSNNCEALRKICANQQVDAEQAREWEVSDAEYCLAQKIALLARRVERAREGLGNC